VKVIPVEANVVLVSRPGAVPQTDSDNVDQPAGERSLGNVDSTRLTANYNAIDTGCQSQSGRVARRPRKRSSVAVDDLASDDTAGQSDSLTSGKRTSIPHQKHSDTGDREHRPKRKGNISISICFAYKYNKLCSWRHNMPPALSSPVGAQAPRAPAAEQTQRSNTFPRRLRSLADRCSRLTR